MEREREREGERDREREIERGGERERERRGSTHWDGEMAGHSAEEWEEGEMEE